MLLGPLQNLHFDTLCCDEYSSIYNICTYLAPLKHTFFTYSSHGWVKRGLPYIQAYFEEILAIVSRGSAVYVYIVV